MGLFILQPINCFVPGGAVYALGYKMNSNLKHTQHPQTFCYLLGPGANDIQLPPVPHNPGLWNPALGECLPFGFLAEHC